MPEPLKLVRIPSLKTVEDFRRHAASLGIEKIPGSGVFSKRHLKTVAGKPNFSMLL
jgi:hypothetical protein